MQSAVQSVLSAQASSWRRPRLPGKRPWLPRLSFRQALKRLTDRLGLPQSVPIRQKRKWMLPRLPCMTPWLPKDTFRYMLMLEHAI